MIFVDTAAIYAGVDDRDAAHERARRQWVALREARADRFSHALVEIAMAALLRTRVGVAAIRAFLDRIPPLIFIGEADRDERRHATAALADDGRRDLSIVDRVSFRFMRERRTTLAFTFDRRFAEAGFDQIGPEAA